MQRTLHFLPCLLLPLVALDAHAQCVVGEMEITIDVLTDDWGNETYWQLVPYGNTCDQAPLFVGGNAALDCSSAGSETSPAGGYASNTTINEGPWCLAEGSQWSIISIDSYGDGHAMFRIYADGASIGEYTATGGFAIHSFTVAAPLDIDMGMLELTTPLFNRVGQPTAFSGVVRNFGALTVNSFDLEITFNGIPTFTIPITGISIPSGNSYEFLVDGPWTPSVAEEITLTARAVAINGLADEAPANDVAGAELLVNPAIPDIIADYFGIAPTMVVIGDDDQDLLTPRDLDFHPDPERNEIWVINKDVAGTGGSTVRFFNPGQVDQTHLWQRDPNAGHFMSLPSGIAMGDNGNFSTCPGIFDANQNGGDPFTGPTLWSADPAVYAFPGIGPLGSHLDMLHVNPNSQGIAHDRWNRYWVVDGFHGDVVMNDFRKDHGAGNTWHGDAVIRRYDGIGLMRDPNDHIVSHTILDKNTGWLYVVDHGNDRVVRLNTLSGSVAGAPTFGPFESYVEYSQMSGHTWETVVTTGLIEPAGIDMVGNKLLVSDHATGIIHVYDISSPTFDEIGTIDTGMPGIMGIVVGPDGRIWFVNATTHSLFRIDTDQNVGIAGDDRLASVHVYPNPANDRIYLSNTANANARAAVNVMDATGRMVIRTNIASVLNGIDVSALAPGAYTVTIGSVAQRVVIAR